MLTVRDANQRLGLELLEDGSYTTIAGFLLAKAGRLLDPGETVKDAAGVFQIESVDRRRICRVRFSPAISDKDKPATLSGLWAVFGVPSLMMKNISTIELLPLNVYL